MYEVARVSITVAAHNGVRPPLHGISVWPSGLLPSDLVRPDGSLIAGIPALLRLRCIRSLMLLCLACRPIPKNTIAHALLWLKRWLRMRTDEVRKLPLPTVDRQRPSRSRCPI